MRVALHILDANEEKRLVLELGGAGVEDSGNPVRPHRRREDRVSLISAEEPFFCLVRHGIFHLCRARSFSRESRYSFSAVAWLYCSSRAEKSSVTRPFAALSISGSTASGLSSSSEK